MSVSGNSIANSSPSKTGELLNININNNNTNNNNNNNGTTTTTLINQSQTCIPSSASASCGTPPTPSFNTKYIADGKKNRGAPLQVLLPKLPSSDSLSNSPGPGSPGLTNWTESSPKIDGASSDKISDAVKLNRKESYKAQRKNYRREKKRVASELLNSLQDPAIIVLADWLKVRGTLKSWTKLWCVLKPGLLVLYKSPKTKSSHWVGTILLTSCKIIERPSKKDGFCFKLFHPLDQTIWAPRGPDNESIGAVVQPLPTSYLIFRAPSQAAGKCWMDALEVSLRCSALLLRSISGGSSSCGGGGGGGGGIVGVGGIGSVGNHNEQLGSGATVTHETQWSEADYEKHFNEHDLDMDSQVDGGNAVLSGLESESECSDAVEIEDESPETPYAHCPEDEFGAVGEQVEELAEEHKSLIWFLVKQVRPGMDLSKVVLPTFILEPRSFLDKLSDSYYHADYLSKAVLEDDPFTRMKYVVQWYLSGFYKKPKGLKKPYNPILGETFRCYWQHENGSRTFYIAEQVSHHPPISAFYVTNRQDGFCISCSMLARSKFYGNSTSAILDGTATLKLLPRGENYTLTIPYAHCKGILMGTLSMELGGKITIECENTGYKTDIEFKLKPFLGGSEYTNLVSGRLKLGKDTLAVINGHWDSELKIKDTRSGEETILFSPTYDVRGKRLKRFTVPIDAQDINESERLWQLVSSAIHRDDQVAATEEKTILEEAQRVLAKERKATCTEWIPVHFVQDLVTGQWHYKYADLRPWDLRNDLRQYESNYRILTKTRHHAPIVRTSSIISSEPIILQADSRAAASLVAIKKAATKRSARNRKMSTPDIVDGSDSSHSNSQSNDIGKILDAIKTLIKKQEEQTKKLAIIQLNLDKLSFAPTRNSPDTINYRTIIYIIIGLFINAIFTWLFRK